MLCCSNFTGGEAADKNGLIGGLEVCMWSEYVDATNFISRIWPRAAAVAERAWSAKDVTDVNDARERLHEFRCKLLQRGIGTLRLAYLLCMVSGIGFQKFFKQHSID